MLAIVFYLIVIALGFIFTQNRVVNIIQCLFVVILFGFSQDYNDFYVYEQVYDGVQHGYQIDYEVGYIWLNRIIGGLGADYVQYRMIIGVLFCLIMYPVVRSMSMRPNFVWSCYLIYSAMFDSCVLRNSLAMVLALTGFFFFFKAEICRTKALTSDFLLGGYYSGLVFLSILFFVLSLFMHSAFWITLIFIPLWFILNSKKGIVKVIIVVVILYLACFFSDNTIFSIYSKLLIREASTDKYMTNAYSNIFGVVYNVLKYLFLMFPILFYNRQNQMLALNSLNNYVCDKTGATLIPQAPMSLYSFLNANILKLNILFCVVLIPQHFAVNFSRLFRMLIVFNYMYISSQVNCPKIKNFMMGLAYAMVLASLAYFFESPNTLNDILFMHIETNSFLNLFNW